MSNPGDYYGMATTISDKDRRIAELKTEKEGYEAQWIKFEEEIERLRESEEFFSGKCGDAELKILELEAKLLKVTNEKRALLDPSGELLPLLTTLGKENEDGSE